MKTSDRPEDRSPYLQNRAPLRARPFLELPFGAIRPAGWLRQQLVDMKNGMAGKLDELYPAVLGNRNGWQGGDGDVWERGPYWLDGLVPLAYILDDPALKAKIRPWIEWLVANQMEDGYFGPILPATEPGPEPGQQRDRARDWWPKMVMLKVLQQYYIATQDAGVLNLMLRYARYQLKLLPDTPLGHYSWRGTLRGADNLLVVYWLYNITGENFLLKLAGMIHRQTFDWTGTFLNTDDVASTYKFYGVNLAQGIKSPVIYYQQDPDARYLLAVRKALRDIRGLHGEEQGSEVYTKVELMYSLENMMTIAGDVGMMDHLERIAYNGTHLHQGWPRFVQNLWHSTAKGGLAALIYASCSVKAKVAGGTEVEITEETAYPSGDKIRFTYQSAHDVSFPLHLRIPGSCTHAMIRVNGQMWTEARGSQIVMVFRKWKKGDVVELELSMTQSH